VPASAPFFFGYASRVIAQAWPAYSLNLSILPQMLRAKQGGCLMRAGACECCETPRHQDKKIVLMLLFSGNEGGDESGTVLRMMDCLL